MQELIILFFSMLIQVIIPPIPAELIVIAAGKIYGTMITTAVAGSGLFLGSIIVYIIGRVIKKKVKFFNDKKVKHILERIKKYENFILWIRILPYNPSDIISYATGIIQVNKKKYVIISLFTSFIRCFLLAIMGSYIDSIRTGLSVAGLLIISAIGAHVLIKRK